MASVGPDVRVGVLNKFGSAVLGSLSRWHINKYFTHEELAETSRLIKEGELAATLHLVTLVKKPKKKTKHKKN